MNWEEMFWDLLDDVAQIPHPLADEIVKEWSEEAKDV